MSNFLFVVKLLQKGGENTLEMWYNIGEVKNATHEGEYYGLKW